MNDRYLFRAKRIDNGEWVIGDLSHHKTGKIFIKPLNGSASSSCVIDKDTICQYTGLTDKNGQKIWENDVVNCFEAECCGKISWNESEAGFYFDALLEDGTYEEEHIYDYADCMEVIGNIFDNPELLNE